MSNLNTILNKLGKIEEIHETNLGKHEIELGKLDDLNKMLQEIKGSGRNIAATGRKSVSALVNTTLPLIDNTRKQIIQAQKDFDLLSKQAKDLGVEIPSNINALIKEAIAEESDLLELRKAIEKFEISYLDLTDNF